MLSRHASGTAMQHEECQKHEERTVSAASTVPMLSRPPSAALHEEPDASGRKLPCSCRGACAPAAGELALVAPLATPRRCASCPAVAPPPCAGCKGACAPTRAATQREMHAPTDPDSAHAMLVLKFYNVLLSIPHSLPSSPVAHSCRIPRRASGELDKRSATEHDAHAASPNQHPATHESMSLKDEPSSEPLYHDPASPSTPSASAADFAPPRPSLLAHPDSRGAQGQRSKACSLMGCVSPCTGELVDSGDCEPTTGAAVRTPSDATTPCDPAPPQGDGVAAVRGDGQVSEDPRPDGAAPDGVASVLGDGQEAWIDLEEKVGTRTSCTRLGTTAHFCKEAAIRSDE